MDVVVLSTRKPVVSIDTPQNGMHFIQFTTIPVKASAYHENGISKVWFLVNETVKDSSDYSNTDIYNFSFSPDSTILGETELKVMAEAATVSVKGETSVVIFIEGILPGKIGE